METFIEEFRGVDNLCFAQVLADDNESGTGHGYVTGAVEELAGIAELSKTTEQSSEVKHYDNRPALVIKGEGADTATFTVSVIALAKLAKLVGKSIDVVTGAFLDGEAETRYFAVGYRMKLTDGTHRYVWRYKGTFAVPDENTITKNSGTDSRNQTLVYTGINTNHKFTKAVDDQGKPKTQRALVVDERDNLADLSTFFDTVTTCDTLQAKNA